MNTNELLKVRHKILKPLPGNTHFEVGKTYFAETFTNMGTGNTHQIAEFPENAQKLKWHEERNYLEMPSYVKEISTNKVVALNSIDSKDLDKYLPATEDEFNAQTTE